MRKTLIRFLEWLTWNLKGRPIFDPGGGIIHVPKDTMYASFSLTGAGGGGVGGGSKLSVNLGTAKHYVVVAKGIRVNPETGEAKNSYSGVPGVGGAHDGLQDLPIGALVHTSPDGSYGSVGPTTKCNCGYELKSPNHFT